MPPALLQASSQFSVAAMRQLAAIHAAKGESVLASNLQRHITTAEARQAQKRSGVVHGSGAWQQFFAQVGAADQAGLAKAARSRKRELGLIKVKQQPQQQQQQPTRQRLRGRQQAVQPAAAGGPAGSGSSSSSAEGFDFEAAVRGLVVEAAAAQRQRHVQASDQVLPLSAEQE
jgi:hypothetical protein